MTVRPGCTGGGQSDRPLAAADIEYECTGTNSSASDQMLAHGSEELGAGGVIAGCGRGEAACPFPRVA